MNLATVFAVGMLAVSAGAAFADPLTEKSTAPDWAKASAAEKDAWIGAYKFKNADADKAAVSTCLDQYAGKPLFETNALSGVTGMCETIATLPQ